MSGPVDTSAAAVEAMCNELRAMAEHATYAIIEEECLGAAALLRALLRERDEARQEASDARLSAAKFHTLACEHKAALATARADALREAAEIARCVPIPDDASADEAHGRISAALQAAINILALIPQEKPHD